MENLRRATGTPSRGRRSLTRLGELNIECSALKRENFGLTMAKLDLESKVAQQDTELNAFWYKVNVRRWDQIHVPRGLGDIVKGIKTVKDLRFTHERLDDR